MIATADLMDIAPEAPSCLTQFRIYGKRRAFYGKIRTVRCLNDNILAKKLFAEKSDGEVIVIDGQGNMDGALIGDMNAELARKNGWAGLVINGAIRDSALINEMDFCIKALGTNPKKSGKTGAGELGVAVAFGGVVFREGDWLYSDEDGIVVSETPLHAK